MSAKLLFKNRYLNQEFSVYETSGEGLAKNKLFFVLYWNEAVIENKSMNEAEIIMKSGKNYAVLISKKLPVDIEIPRSGKSKKSIFLELIVKPSNWFSIKKVQIRVDGNFLCGDEWHLEYYIPPAGANYIQNHNIIYSDQYEPPISSNHFERQNSDLHENDSESASSEDISVESVGTGFFINEEGYAVTNNHVVNGKKNLTLSIKEKDYKARVIAIDAQNDLAILKTDEKVDHFFFLASEDAQRMDDVIAIGFGFGKSISNEVKTTKGVVSALAGINNNYSQVQIDASLQPGNSGGPVINSNGLVIGVAVAKMDAEVVFQYTGSLPEGISFAIKSSTLKQFLSSNGIKFYSSIENELTKKQINKNIDSSVLFIN